MSRRSGVHFVGATSPEAGIDRQAYDVDRDDLIPLTVRDQLRGLGWSLERLPNDVGYVLARPMFSSADQFLDNASKHLRVGTRVRDNQEELCLLIAGAMHETDKALINEITAAAYTDAMRHVESE